MGSRDLAAEHFENAATFCRDEGYQPELDTVEPGFHNLAAVVLKVGSREG